MPLFTFIIILLQQRVHRAFLIIEKLQISLSDGTNKIRVSNRFVDPRDEADPRDKERSKSLGRNLSWTTPRRKDCCSQGGDHRHGRYSLRAVNAFLKSSCSYATVFLKEVCFIKDPCSFQRNASGNSERTGTGVERLGPMLASTSRQLGKRGSLRPRS